jgi:hypothetical protein
MAALPAQGVTAYLLLKVSTEVRPGESVLRPRGGESSTEGMHARVTGPERVVLRQGSCRVRAREMDRFPILWEALAPSEQARIVRLLVVDYRAREICERSSGAPVPSETKVYFPWGKASTRTFDHGYWYGGSYFLQSLPCPLWF